MKTTRGLSDSTEIAIINMLSGMVEKIESHEFSDEKLVNLVKSRNESFTAIKEMLGLWQNSPNAPSNAKLLNYTQKLILAGENSVKILEDALVKEIDFDNLDIEKYGVSMKSKPLIFKSIQEIKSGLRLLEKQIETNTVDFKEKDFKPGYPERFAKQEFYPLSDYYKNWYDEKNDVILIDPKGTKGEIIELDGLKIQLPAVPKNKKDILFHRLPKEEQYWRRTPMPKGLTVENEDAYSEYILEEYRRRREGIWFYNNGSPVYLTGSHYFALQWCMLKDERFTGYMGFRYAQANMFYHTEACVIDTRCLGQFFVKSRRTGYTFEKLFRMLNEFTTTRQANFGITSKSDDDAKKAFKKLSFAFLNLPFFFRPIVKSKEDSDVIIELAKPQSSSLAAKKSRDTSTEDYLNSTFDYEPTKEDAYDGQAMYRYLADEASKWKRGLSFLKHWGEVAPTLDEGGSVVGKAFVGSTVAAKKDGGENYLSLYTQSQLDKRDKITQRTPSGLYPYFLPAHKNMADFTDVYGVCHEILEPGQSFINTKGVEKKIGALQFLYAKRESKRKEGPVDYNNELRAFPITIHDAFRDELQTQLFDIEKINDQISHNNKNLIHNNLVQGNFVWKNGVKFTEVEWRPNDKGRFLLSWIPDVEFRNKWVEKSVYGIRTKCPASPFSGTLACDPYDKDAVVDSKLVDTENGVQQNLGSRGAIHGLTGYNINNAPSNEFFLEYICRPKDAEMFFEDALMASIFYSMPILTENNKQSMLEYFYRNGYRGYQVSRFDKDPMKLSADEKKYGGMPNSSPNMINAHWTSLESYINKFVGKYEITDGEKPIREEGAMGYMPFNKTLQDWLRFDPKKRTDYDASISSGLCIMAINQESYRPKVEKKAQVLRFKRYS
jgi:hypothetical protein